MTFDYVPVIVDAADDGEPLMLYRPEITVAIRGPSHRRVVRALVDTGADYTIFPTEIAAEAGIQTLPGAGPPIQAFGGQAINLHYADVVLQLGSGDSAIRWTTRVFFADDPSSDGTAVFGHFGCLEFFTVTFRGDANFLEIEPNEHLPRTT